MKCNVKYIVLSFALLSVAFISCTSDKDQLRKQIQSELNVINEKAPVQLNDGVRLDSCRLYNDQIDYYYTVTDSLLSTDKNYLQSLEKEVRDALKEDSEMNRILDNDISIQYNYRNNGEAIVLSFRL